MPDADITDYAPDTTPSIQKTRHVTLGSRRVGAFGLDLTNGKTRVYVSERETDEHRYRGADPWYEVDFDGPAYGLSAELMPRITGADVGRIYIIETDEGTIHMFGTRQFADAEVINDSPEAEGRGYEKDPQYVVPVDEAVESWEGAYPGCYAKQPPFR